MRMLKMEPWTYVGFVVFPNIDNRKSLLETGLVKQEEELKVWNFFKKGHKRFLPLRRF